MSQETPWWVYAALILLTGLWAFCVAVLLTFFFPWNPYIVWTIAWGIAILAIVYKVARHTR